MRLGWRTPKVDSLKRAEIVFIYVAVMCTTAQGTEQIRVCVMINPPRTVARKCSLGGLCVCAGRFDIESLLKSPLIYSIP